MNNKRWQKGISVLFLLLVLLMVYCLIFAGNVREPAPWWMVTARSRDYLWYVQTNRDMSGVFIRILVYTIEKISLFIACVAIIKHFRRSFFRGLVQNKGFRLWVGLRLLTMFIESYAYLQGARMLYMTVFGPLFVVGVAYLSVRNEMV